MVAHIDVADVAWWTIQGIMDLQYFPRDKDHLLVRATDVVESVKSRFEEPVEEGCEREPAAVKVAAAKVEAACATPATVPAPQSHTPATSATGTAIPLQVVVEGVFSLPGVCS